ncbi:GntR family transcriptional regulator [Streptomyces nanshensis]|uniref:HTH gntR-type domain-containing protein n=1 Tax=Streptomyces nanshensis TaxID=518642 RepID=A0A1E7KZE9_9ACTN|nr:GntR family transcriptional regulator [Streptomyces nanshensis]OEV09299.1 hypothetical protein AN218_22965 [Streptomyces nanshensis]
MTRPKPQTARGVAAAIRAQIASGDYAPGGQLASTAKLASEFQVSEKVIYNAITLLKDGGVLVGRQGLGVFVRTYDYLEWRPDTGHADWAGQVLAQGRIPSAFDPRTTTEEADADVARWLNVDEGTPVAVSRQLRCVDGEPVQLLFHYALDEGGAGASVTEPDEATRDGTSADDEEQEVTTRMPAIEEVASFELEDLPGTPVSQHARIRRGADEEPVGVTVAITRGDRVRIVYGREP